VGNILEVNQDNKSGKMADSQFERKRKRMTAEEAQAIWERTKGEEPLELERNDLKAIILAALVVFIPFVLAFGGVLLLIWWFIMFVWGG